MTKTMMISDRIEHLGKSVIQHGKNSDRIYLMKLDEDDAPSIISQLESLAQEHGYTKIFAKVLTSLEREFTQNGYVLEARIPGLCLGTKDYSFLAKFFSEQRKVNALAKEIEHVLVTAGAKALNSNQLPSLDNNLNIRRLCAYDAPLLATLYQQVFETYPFPIHDPEYLRQTMEDNIIYFGVFAAERLVAAASSETDVDCQNAEMTDFATLPEYRGKNLSLHLLMSMERDMRQADFQTLYTIARAVSYGMNTTFSKAGYNYAGTLINNTDISGNLESMNVWYKHL